MPGQSVNVFVSYSHSDASLVAPVVKLLRVNKTLVFLDTDRIPPGKRWRDEIAEALAKSNLVVVFWCYHAYRSTEVSTEWKAAIEQEKDLLPLLLDATPLPSELGQFQWIDFRGTVGASHSSIDSGAYEVPITQAPPPMAARPRRAVWYTLAGAAATVAVVVYGSLLRLSAPSPASPLPQPDASGSVLIRWILLPLGVVVAVGAYLLWLRRRAKPGRRIEAMRPDQADMERRMAVELEAEILRRTASAQGGGA